MFSTPPTPRPASSSRASSRAGSRGASPSRGTSRSSREGRAQLRTGDAPVRDAALLLARELGHGASVAGDDEDRVIAEPLAAARRLGDLPEHLAAENLDPASGPPQPGN